ncbi:MAG: response regulator [Acidobacteriota bacterium]
MDASPLVRILHVEDDTDIQAIARLALAGVGGLEVETCGTGEEALRLAVTFQPDLILLDVMMPDMDGVTTLRKLRQNPQTQAVPVVFMTAKVQMEEMARLKAEGALDVLVKPFDPMTLADQLRRIWARRR